MVLLFGFKNGFCINLQEEEFTAAMLRAAEADWGYRC